jgi:hypothetical protein
VHAYESAYMDPVKVCLADIADLENQIGTTNNQKNDMRIKKVNTNLKTILQHLSNATAPTLAPIPTLGTWIPK